MQDISAPRPRKLKERACVACGTTFHPATNTNKHCPPCQVERTRKLKSEAGARRNDGTNKRFCVDCGAEIPPVRGRPSIRCGSCRAIFWKAHNRTRNKERTENGERKVYDERYREDNRKTVRASNRKYKAAHPETDEAANARRRSRLMVGMTDEDCRLSRLFRQVSKGFPCFYCGAPVPVGAKPHELEHYFPLSEFGTDHFWNLLRACQACNRGPGGKGKTCGTAFLLRTLPPGADWPRPVTLAGFPLLPATGILFQHVKAADYFARHLSAA